MMSISMGGCGALLLAEKYPHLVAAAAAISPAIWISAGSLGMTAVCVTATLWWLADGRRIPPDFGRPTDSEPGLPGGMTVGEGLPLVAKSRSNIAQNAGAASATGYVLIVFVEWGD